jgi:hypothetical protein
MYYLYLLVETNENKTLQKNLSVWQIFHHKFISRFKVLFQKICGFIRKNKQETPPRSNGNQRFFTVFKKVRD